MDRYEESVLDYISADKLRFISPQFDIPYENEMGGSCPDFVVVDYKDRTIYIIEVTTSSNMRSLTEKIEQRRTRWIEPLQRHFEKISQDFVSWDYRMTAFVRQTNKNALQQKFAYAQDVSIFSLEEISFPYSWNWNGEEANNPLK